MLSRRSFVFSGLALGGAVLSGCKTAPSSYEYAELTYTHLPPYNLLVQDVVVDQAYVSPAKSPNVEHLFDIPPAQASERWARDRLYPQGNSNVLNFVIKNAAVTESKLEQQKGITGLFTYDQSERYTGVLEVELQVLNDQGFKEASVIAKAERSVTVAENIKLRDREKVWYKLTEDLMMEIDRQLQQGIAKHLSHYVL
ncbi:hypothetical protein WH95_19125 [Kiloniella litopenaei]|uniref:ABC-type transport auxiliary lipoprotein component domain-containing protein n=1 Tax=Kiloniella litopenaei TaxID=1549748 RepID=A0A0M2R0C7_9PROT|nr:hypothetical protein [Kiloniella litopenaei]KKJ75337.1 hypothetical protein WH95_19125 [Kiloniella litopenaei]